MKEIHIGPHTHAERAEQEAIGTFDREINLKGIFWTVVGLTAVTVVAALLMWWLIVGFNRFDESRDPRPSPLRGANEQPLPPLPLLQTNPEVELNEMRAEEEQQLVGIEKAMETVVERGLGPLTPVPSPAPPSTPSPGEGRPLPSPTPSPERR